LDADGIVTNGIHVMYRGRSVVWKVAVFVAVVDSTWL